MWHQGHSLPGSICLVDLQKGVRLDAKSSLALSLCVISQTKSVPHIISVINNCSRIFSVCLLKMTESFLRPDCFDQFTFKVPVMLKLRNVECFRDQQTFFKSDTNLSGMINCFYTSFYYYYYLMVLEELLF